MKYLKNNKVYDTEKSTKIITYIKPIEHEGLILTTYPKYRHTLYKSPKGQFFTHVGEYVGRDIAYGDKDYIELLSDEEVKKIFEALNDVETYKKYLKI